MLMCFDAEQNELDAEQIRFYVNVNPQSALLHPTDLQPT